MHRSLLVAEITIPGLPKPLIVGSTHLDHEMESSRLVGIELVHRCLSKYGDHILIGDMNTLRFEDYNVKQWAKMLSFRSNRNWEPPSGLNYNKIMSLGYHDGHLLTHSAGQPLFTAHSNDPFCRIDYVLFSSPSFFNTSTTTLHRATETKSTTTVTSTKHGVRPVEMDHKGMTTSAATPSSTHENDAKHLAATVTSVGATTTPVVSTTVPTTSNGVLSNPLIVKHVFVDTTAHGSDHFPLCCDFVIVPPIATTTTSKT